MTSPRPSSSNMPATRPRWSKTWLRYVGWSAIILSSDGEEILMDLQGNAKITQIAQRGAESRLQYRGGSSKTHRVETLLGTPERPLSEADLHAKVQDCARFAAKPSPQN